MVVVVYGCSVVVVVFVVVFCFVKFCVVVCGDCSVKIVDCGGVVGCCVCGECCNVLFDFCVMFDCEFEVFGNFFEFLIVVVVLMVCVLDVVCLCGCMCCFVE